MIAMESNFQTRPETGGHEFAGRFELERNLYGNRFEYEVQNCNIDAGT